MVTSRATEMSAENGSLYFAISGKHHTELQKHLYPGDGKEAVAILLCGRAKGNGRESLLVRDVVAIPYESCRIRAVDRVTWSPEAMIPALTRAMNEGLAVVKVHSHPGGHEAFSLTDDESDEELFTAVYGWLETNAMMASLIMLPSGRMFGRSIYSNGIGMPIDVIRVVGDDFMIWRAECGEKQVPEHARRIAQTFGDATYHQLRTMRIGVVGCSGTGSIVIEQLARNCVGDLIIVDPDSIEQRNLNRILNGTWMDAQQGANKTDVMSRAVLAMGFGTNVTAFATDMPTVETVKALASCDVIFGCVDSIDGRHFLNKISSYYLIPYIDVGVRIDADGLGGVEHVWAAVHTIQPGGSSLLSRKVYSQADLEASMMKKHNPDIYAKRLTEGYIRGVRVEQPAVISVNMIAAATAVNELLARLHPYRVSPNSDFAARRISLSDHIAGMDEQDGEACAIFSKYVGLGDQAPLLGVMGIL